MYVKYVYRKSFTKFTACRHRQAINHHNEAHGYCNIYIYDAPFNDAN